MALKPTLVQINALSVDEFNDRFKNIIECYPAAANAIQKLRPFRNLEHFLSTVHSFMDNLSLEEKEHILVLHPDLAGRLADEGKLTAESTKEQSIAGLNIISLEEKREMNLRNKRYRDKFGFPFVICARENKIKSILDGLELRINNTKENEVNTGIEEVKKICYYRILELIETR